MRIPVKRFFLLYRQIERIQAEETLLQLRVTSYPYRDSKTGDGGFVDDLMRAARIEQKEKTVNLMSATDLAAWGIGRRYTNPEEDTTKLFHVVSKED